MMERTATYKGIGIIAMYKVTEETVQKEVPPWVATLSYNGKLERIGEIDKSFYRLETPDGEMLVRDGDYLVATERFEVYGVSGDLVEMTNLNDKLKI